ncbi:hypothetical protein M3Y96_00469000 [Aphelenchoides besseyi]|nr:hypothetical protein M3Y96_00469000 [Aphelenchoides besseyi]
MTEDQELTEQVENGTPNEHRPRMFSRSSKVSPVDVNNSTTKIVQNDSKLFSTTWTSPEVEDEGSSQEGSEESRLSFVLQCFIPFLLAGLGMVAAGLLLERASSWYFLSTVKEALIMVPALLGLKGNLEMTLASRLSTLANCGHMETRKQQLAALTSNLALVQAQAIVVSFVASILAVATSVAEGQSFVWNHFVSLTLTGVLTASVASLILSTAMVILAILCKKCNVNPDNICTPIAAAFGDVVTLGFMILFGTWLTSGRDQDYIIQSIVLILFLCSTLIWVLIAYQNNTTRQVVIHGWYVIIVAMCISSGGGYVLKFAVSRFKALAVFQPVINGVGGNLVAVQASRISTYLHRFGKPGVLPANSVRVYFNPLRTFALRGCHPALHLSVHYAGNVASEDRSGYERNPGVDKFSIIGMENLALRNPKSAINRVKQMENKSSPGPAMLQSTPANGSATKRCHVLFSPIGLPVGQSPISRPKFAETAEPKAVEPVVVEPIPIDPKPSTTKQTAENHTPDLEPLASIDNSVQVNPASLTGANTKVNDHVMASGRPRRKAAPKNLKEPDLIHKMRRLK